jgi:hypothetical protein
VGLLLVLAACGGSGGTAPGGPGPGPQAIPPPPPPAPQPQPPSSFDTPEYRRSDAAVASNVLGAWSEGASGAGVTVATLDSGIAAASPEFAGRIHPASRDVTGSGRAITDEGGHGTSVAAVLAAARDNAGIVGIAPEARLAVFRADRPGSCGTADGCVYNDSALAVGIDAAIAAGARAINMSLGGTGASPVLREAFARAGRAGVVLVISAGNDSATSVDGLALSALQAGNPATVIVVGSVGATRQLSTFSNQAGNAAGNYLAALGERVRSFDQTGQAFLYSGTSYSAPQVTGAIALLAQAFPQLGADELVRIVLQSADDAGLPGVDQIYGSGILNIGRAFQPIGGTSIAATGIPIATTPGGNGQMGSAFGDGGALGAALGLIPVADSFGRMFALPVASTLRTAPAGRLAARIGIPPGLAGSAVTAGPLRLAASGIDPGVRPVSADTWRWGIAADSHRGFAQRGLAAAPARARLGGQLDLGRLSLTLVEGPLRAGTAAGAPALVAPDGLAQAEDLTRRTQRVADVDLALGAVRIGLLAEAGRAPAVPGRSLPQVREERTAARLAWRDGALGIAGRVAAVRSEGAFLGSRFAPAIGVTGGRGLEAGLAIDAALSGLTLRAAGTFGQHRPQLSGAGLLRASGENVRTVAWSVDASWPMLAGQTRVTVAQPQLVTGGDLLRFDPLSGRAEQPVPLAPEARERALEVGWAGHVAGVGDVAFGAFHRANAGHHRSLSDTGAALSVSRRF